MQAITAPALPSSVPSPQPTTPASVSSFTNTNGRSESGVRETPNTFIPVIFTREPTPRKASAPSGFCGGAMAHPHDPDKDFPTDEPMDRPATSAPAAPPKNCRRFMPHAPDIFPALPYPRSLPNPAL